MSFLTGRDLECLARLKANWRQFYVHEVERLLKEDADQGYARRTDERPAHETGNQHAGAASGLWFSHDIAGTRWSSRSIPRQRR